MDPTLFTTPGVKASVLPSAPADRDLRDRIAEAVRTFDFAHYGLDSVDIALHDYPEDQEWVPVLADAVLTVLPAPADRAAVLREAADALLMTWGGSDHADGMQEAREQLRRMADEAQQAEAETRVQRVQCNDCGAVGEVFTADDGLAYLAPSGQVGHQPQAGTEGEQR